MAEVANAFGSGEPIQAFVGNPLPTKPLAGPRGVGKGFPTYGGTVVGRQSLADEDAWPGHGV
ncbi:MAG: hypothetical protein LOY00_05135, partial [Methylocaldum sp.]|nr:hypothetical protein [Methylocaldum sp.]